MILTSSPRLTLLFIAIACAAGIAHGGESNWFKGNTHTHSLWSDGNDFPEMIATFYKGEGYHFLVLSDHNVLSRGEKWMGVRDVEKRRRTLGHSTMKKYLAAFGDKWVERRGKGDAEQVRLKTLEEIRPRFDEPGKFLFIEGEEITNGFRGLPVHTNAMNLGEIIKPKKGATLRDTMRSCLIAAKEQEKRLGKLILAHLNHPNFGWGITPEDLAHVIEEQFFEVYNGHPGVRHLGDAKHPGVEKMWDLANTIRLATLGAEPLFGIASDDSHHYHGGDVKPGRGWVMVRASSLSADNIVKAMREGDFYCSSGITLEVLERNQDKGTLSFRIKGEDKEKYTTRIIGTRRGQHSDPAKVGEVLATFTGTSVSYSLKDNELYFRATITSDKDHPLPSFAGQKKAAWIQPVWTQPVSKPEAGKNP
ncbi:MAG: hypothetical protein GY899_06965 [Verrucomicrobiaceae bacterium]|nr:hypothetical protein [Verrucomicrobiaceae bacterium]